MNEDRYPSNAPRTFLPPWTTGEEINFLVGLGTHRSSAPKNVDDVPVLERYVLLRNYQRSMTSRNYWGGIDRNEIAKVVAEMIAVAEAKLRR